jgi:hypothetical protein
VIPTEQSADKEIRSEQEPVVTSKVGTSLPPIPPMRRIELAKSKVQNFVIELKLIPLPNVPSSSRIAAVVRESTVVDLS